MMTKEEIKELAIKQLSKELNIADYLIRVDAGEQFLDRCMELAVKNNAALSDVRLSAFKEALNKWFELKDDAELGEWLFAKSKGIEL